MNTSNKGIAVAVLAIFGLTASDQSSAQPQKAGPCVEAKNTVHADRDWQEISPNVSAGDLLQFKAFGSWTYVKGAGHASGPDGYSPGPADAAPFQPQFKLPSAPIGTLIARIGNNAPFVVGSSRITSAANSGPLYMRMNDVNHEDNGGTVSVEFKICRNA